VPSIDTAAATSVLANRAPLTFPQEFLCMFERGDGTGPFGPRHIIVNGWRVGGAIQHDTLRVALTDLVVRHEALRTKVVRDEGARYQEVCPPGPPELRVLDLSGTDPAARDRRVEELLIEVEAGTHDVDDLPLLRAVLGRFDDNDSVLVLVSHHSAVDEWSMKMLMRDLAVSYAARRGHHAPELPEVRQYREYAAWQHSAVAGDAAGRSREYWQEKLGGAEMLAVRTDHPRSANLPKKTSVYRFFIDAELTSAVLDLAKATRSSPFMVSLAAYQVLLHGLTGATDIVVPTMASGRGQARFHDTVGLFYNFVPLRTDLAGCATFRAVVERTRATCIQAYSREIPFAQVMAEAPALMAPLAADDRAVIAFQLFQFPFLLHREVVGDLEFSDVRRRLLSQPDGVDVPDGALLQLDIDSAGDMIGYLYFNSNLFSDSTMTDLVAKFRQVLRRTVTAPDAPPGRALTLLEPAHAGTAASGACAVPACMRAQCVLRHGRVTP
jgi:hypothetical protein